MRVIVRTALMAFSVAVVIAACAAPPRAPAPIDRGSASTAPSAVSCGRSVTVRRGDTLSAIARRCDVALSDLAAENGLRPPYALQTGQPLRIPGPPVYTVRRGDNLYRIALAHDMSTTELAQLNGLRRPYTIYPGQDLRVRGPVRQVAQSGGSSRNETRTTPAPQRPPVSAPPPVSSAGAPSFQWPLRGEVITRYGAMENGRIDGIRIAAGLGQRVNAAAPGEVVYAGNELQGYGNLVLIRHADNWVTAYGLNSVLRVTVGQQVSAGQHIADAGASGALTRPALHFEVRRGVSPVDPMQVLPAQ